MANLEFITKKWQAISICPITYIHTYVYKITINKFTKIYVETRGPLQAWQLLLNDQVAYSKGQVGIWAE